MTFTLPNLPVVSSYQAGWSKLNLALQHQPAFCMPEYTSPRHVICVNMGKPVTLDRRVDGWSQTLDAVPFGDIGIYPAHLRQTFHWHQDAQFLQLDIEPSLLHQAGAELSPNHTIELLPHLTPHTDPLIYQIAVALKTILETDAANSKLYADTMANALAIHLLYHYSAHKPTQQPQLASKLSKQQLQRVVDYIHANLERNIGLDELANVVQFSPFHFARLFKHATGTPPHQFHIRCRVERVKQLLLDNHLSYAEIAYAVGFASQSHLNHHFKQLVGMTPKAFLQQQ